MEKEGPVPVLENEQTVSIPQTAINIADNDLATLQEAVDTVPHDENGIMAYMSALTTLTRILQESTTDVTN